MNCSGCGKPMSHKAKHGRCWDCYVDSMRAPKGKPKRVYCEPFGWMRLPEGVTVRYIGHDGEILGAAP